MVDDQRMLVILTLLAKRAFYRVYQGLLGDKLGPNIVIFLKNNDFVRFYDSKQSFFGKILISNGCMTQNRHFSEKSRLLTFFKVIFEPLKVSHHRHCPTPK